MVTEIKVPQRVKNQEAGRNSLGVNGELKEMISQELSKDSILNGGKYHEEQ